MKSIARITVPYAVANFIDMRERGFYYVDKTTFIPELELYNALWNSSISKLLTSKKY